MASGSANSRPGFRFNESCCTPSCLENTFRIFTLDSRLPTSNNPRMSAKLTIGFLGAGKMATALARGLVQAKLVGADQIIARDPIDAARAAFAKEVGVKATASNLEAARSAQVLVLAVKPDQVDGVLKEIRGLVTGKHLLCSIAAGVTLAKLESGLADGARVIRVMPNTPALVGASATAYALGRNATVEDGRHDGRGPPRAGESRRARRADERRACGGGEIEKARARLIGMRMKVRGSKMEAALPRL